MIEDRGLGLAWKEVHSPFKDFTEKRAFELNLLLK